MSSDFDSLESPAVGRIDRSLKHFTIEREHLNLSKQFDDFPQRKPMIRDSFEFTPRITGRYANITMGDVSNRLSPKIDEGKKEEDNGAKEQESDEDIFAKIMERRRRELGLEAPEKSNDINAGTKEVVITPETLVVAEAILNRKGERLKPRK